MDLWIQTVKTIIIPIPEIIMVQPVAIWFSAMVTPNGFRKKII